jgi:hypothetical protein
MYVVYYIEATIVAKLVYMYFRVARWFIFKPKIPIWVNFGGPWNGKCWYMYFMTIRNTSRPFGIIYGRLV